MRRIIVSLLATCVLLVSQAAAWNCFGHMLTTQIAVQLLANTPAGHYYDDLSEYQQMQYPRLTSLTEVACWADDVKSFTKQYNTWHYYDQCYLRNATGTNVTCPAEDEGNLTQAIHGAVAKLSLPIANVTKAERAFWLAILVHVVGDAHQPLHTTTLFNAQFPKGDLAGNRFDLKVGNSSTNLHKFLDDIAGLAKPGFPRRPLAKYVKDLETVELMSASLISSQSFAYPSQPNVTDVEVWLREGYAAAVNSTYSYPDGSYLQPGDKVATDSPYVTELRKVLMNKIALAGRRLAKIMLDAYNLASASSTF